MAHGQEPDAYDYLATSKVSDLTVAQLEQALENSYLNKSNIEFWKGPVTMNRVLEVSRTYPHGIVIPEQSVIEVVSLNPTETVDLQPSGTEVWQIAGCQGFGLIGSAAIDISWFDGTLSVLMEQKTVTTGGTMIELNERISAPMFLTNSMYLRLTETGGSNPANIVFAYYKVSL